MLPRDDSRTLKSGISWIRKGLDVFNVYLSTCLCVYRQYEQYSPSSRTSVGGESRREKREQSLPGIMGYSTSRHVISGFNDHHSCWTYQGQRAATVFPVIFPDDVPPSGRLVLLSCQRWNPLLLFGCFSTTHRFAPAELVAIATGAGHCCNVPRCVDASCDEVTCYRRQHTVVGMKVNQRSSRFIKRLCVTDGR